MDNITLTPSSFPRGHKSESKKTPKVSPYSKKALHSINQTWQTASAARSVTDHTDDNTQLLLQ